MNIISSHATKAAGQGAKTEYKYKAP